MGGFALSGSTRVRGCRDEVRRFCKLACEKVVLDACHVGAGIPILFRRVPQCNYKVPQDSFPIIEALSRRLEIV